MTEERINAYEGLFLFPQTVAANLQTAVDRLREILTKADAQIIALRKWEERRLAYEIKGNKRGVYFLVYFRAARASLIGIERSCNLWEQLLRFMIVRADNLTQEQMEAADGTAELADEIKLRAQQASASDAGKAAVVETVADAGEPVTVKTEVGSEDATAT